MNRRLLSYCPMLASVLLAGCWSASKFEPPVGKTNPNPTQRYEIRVELVDPPAEVKSISGAAYFSIPDVACMPTPDRIAGYTPSSSYIKSFALTYAGGNTYKGHIFLDWPIDEDYYDLGVCRWEINTVGAVIDFGGYIQKPVLWGETDFPSAGRKWWCRRPDSQRIIENCTSPSDPERIELESRDSWLVILSAHGN